jgi:hypothetical protein
LRRPPVVVDTRFLDEGDDRRLRHLVDAARFFELPADGKLRAEGPGYELAVTADDGRQHAVAFDHRAAPASLRELVSAVRSAGGALADKAAPG